MPEFCDGERECGSHHVASLWISGFSGTSCDINGPIPVRFGCRNSIRYADTMREAGDGREIDKEGGASNARRMHRCEACRIELF